MQRAHSPQLLNYIWLKSHINKQSYTSFKVTYKPFTFHEVATFKKKEKLQNYRNCSFYIFFSCCKHPILAGRNLCHLLITFTNNLDPDQDQCSVGPDLDSNCLTLRLIVFLKEYFEKVYFINSQQMSTKT